MMYKDLNVEQVNEFIKQKDAIIIDMRDKVSYENAHIENAIHIDGSNIEKLIPLRKANPPVLIYCYHGNSSREMAKMISYYGFTDVNNLVGGWDAWLRHHVCTDQINQNIDNILDFNFG